MKRIRFSDPDTDNIQCLVLELIQQGYKFEHSINSVDFHVIFVYADEEHHECLTELSKQFKIHTFNIY